MQEIFYIIYLLHRYTQIFKIIKLLYYFITISTNKISWLLSYSFGFKLQMYKMNTKMKVSKNRKFFKMYNKLFIIILSDKLL